MQLKDDTFNLYRQWMKNQTGVHLSEIKKTLVDQRLMRRLKARKLESFEAYYRLLQQKEEDAERQMAIDALTTHETFFFREPKHFEWFKQFLLAERPKTQLLRIWSAAASTGEEVWSIGMMLADCLGMQGPWQLLGSDISQPVLNKAKTGHYVMQRCEGIPSQYLKSYCLKGQGPQINTLLMIRELRHRVAFKIINLNTPLPELPPFDVIFLRNVLIYFDSVTKKQVVLRCLERLVPGGFLLVSHSESLNDVSANLILIQAGVYQKIS
jgi:chemotaxis protein methyltransferase CheR